MSQPSDVCVLLALLVPAKKVFSGCWVAISVWRNAALADPLSQGAAKVV